MPYLSERRSASSETARLTYRSDRLSAVDQWHVTSSSTLMFSPNLFCNRSCPSKQLSTTNCSLKLIAGTRIQYAIKARAIVRLQHPDIRCNRDVQRTARTRHAIIFDRRLSGVQLAPHQYLPQSLHHSINTDAVEIYKFRCSTSRVNHLRSHGSSASTSC